MVWLTEAAVIAAMNAVSLVKMENIEDMIVDGFLASLASKSKWVGDPD